jgi:hypothetical protein
MSFQPLRIIRLYACIVGKGERRCRESALAYTGDSIRHHSVHGQVLVITPSYSVLRPREPAAVSAHLLMSAWTLGFCV